MHGNESHNTDENRLKVAEKSEKDERAFKIKAAAFLAGVTGVSILFGFGTTLAAAKKKDPHFFDRGLSGTFDDPQAATPSAAGASASGVRHGARRSMAAAESGASLALRALGWGTLYSVAGCSVLFYAIWKMMGVQNMADFRAKVGDVLPRIPRNNPPQGRTEFSGLNDLLQYIIDEDDRKKNSAGSAPVHPPE